MRRLARKAPISRAVCINSRFPRSDLKVTVDGVPIKPALALGGWVALCRRGQAPCSWETWC